MDSVIDHRQDLDRSFRAKPEKVADTRQTKFCLYVYDSYVYPQRRALSRNLTTQEVNEFTREWIRKRVFFGWLELPSDRCKSAESELRKCATDLEPVVNMNVFSELQV